MTQNDQGQGFIEVVCEPMFADKTEALIQRSNETSQLNKKILSFKPQIDNRYSVKKKDNLSQLQNYSCYFN
ncbi:MAG: hypothetical protein ACQBVK_01665 [Candidatus Phytoplasma sp. TWB_XP]